jgi:3'-phosphoadenosine 5'-phosphosulfate sulfotransferase (PAPS reductase)/FAD synthetase
MNLKDHQTLVVCVSGGKDSAAMAIWLLKESGLPNPTRFVFTDTGHENPVTLEYLDYLEAQLDIKIERVQGPYSFLTLAMKKKRFPSTRVRFCTEELKVKPLARWIDSQEEADPDFDPVVVQGIRREESGPRRMMPEWEESQRGAYDCPMWRPIIDWTWQQVFDIHRKYGIEPNPLYKRGLKRVGCWPCIMCTKGELARAFEEDEGLLDRLRDYEHQVAAVSKRGYSSIFAGDKTPRRFHDREFVREDDGAVFTYASIDGVYRWACDPAQRDLFEGDPPTCMSQYGLCE